MYTYTCILCGSSYESSLEENALTVAQIMVYRTTTYMAMLMKHFHPIQSNLNIIQSLMTVHPIRKY